MLDRRSLTANGFDYGQKVAVVKQSYRFRIVQYECDFLRRQAYVERQQYCSHLHDSIVSRQQFVAVIAEPRHTFASIDSERGERIRQTITTRAIFAIRQTNVAVYDTDFVCK